jgi:aryl-alcohol dehydrogenase-like predicted oxidoreductase
VLVEAMSRFDFDSVLVALNAADVHRLSFIEQVLPQAVRRGMAVIGMKVCAAGQLVGPGGLTIDEAMGYVLSLPGTSTVVIGCRTPEEVRDNARAARQFAPFAPDRMRALERRTLRYAPVFTSYKTAAG